MYTMSNAITFPSKKVGEETKKKYRCGNAYRKTVGGRKVTSHN